MNCLFADYKVNPDLIFNIVYDSKELQEDIDKLYRKYDFNRTPGTILYTSQADFTLREVSSESHNWCNVYSGCRTNIIWEYYFKFKLGDRNIGFISRFENNIKCIFPDGEKIFNGRFVFYLGFIIIVPEDRTEKMVNFPEDYPIIFGGLNYSPSPDGKNSSDQYYIDVGKNTKACR